MYRLTNQQLGHIQSYIEIGIAGLATHGLRYDADCDMTAWADLMRNAPGTVAVTPSFDPEQSDIHAGNCFWSKLLDANDRVVGCAGMRLFVTADILDEIRSWRIFYSKRPVIHLTGLDLVAPYDAPTIGGRVGYSGGYWMHPEYRGTGLTKIFPRIHRALALRHFDLDWTCSLNPDTARRWAMLKESNGWAGRFSCINGYFPARKGHGTYQLAYSSRGDMLSLVRADLEAAAGAGSPLRTAMVAAE